MQVLERPQWQALAASHAHHAEELLAVRESNPVEDFLWTYYATRPTHLTTWHPGFGTLLVGGAADYAGRRGYRGDGENALVDESFVSARAPMIQQLHALLAATAARPAQHGCFGMHEWAMVYGLQPDQIRHAAWPMRFTRDQTMEIVDEVGVRCSHFDAFRFFTDAARPLNPLQPTRESQVALEQPGCIHANMDLLKWALKLMPMVPSSLLLEAFINARELRLLDMQASPYDLSALELEPVRIETSEGRAEYRRRQQALALKSLPIRAQLMEWCERLLFGGATTAQQSIGDRIVERHP